MTSQAVEKYKHLNWTIADQAMVSGVNFFTGLVLARYLGLEEFGIFTLAWSGVLFMQGMQLSVIISPMMSIGPKQLSDKTSDYYGSVLALQIIFSVVCFVLVIIISSVIIFFLPDVQQAQLILPLATAALAFQLQEFVRRYFFSIRKVHLAFINDGISYVGQLGLLLWCFINIPMNNSNVLWVIAATSSLAILFGLRNLPLLVLDHNVIRSVFSRNWTFARWLIGSAIVQWLSGHIFLIAAGSWLGAPIVGAMKSAQNIMGVMHILFQGLENIVPVQAARILSQYGIQTLRLYIFKVTGLGLLGTIMFAVLVAGVSPEFWMSFFYGEAFAAYGHLLVWYGLIYPFVFLSLMLRIWFRTLENTRPIFLSYLAMTIVGVIVVYPLMLIYEENGVMMGVLVTNVVMVVGLSWFVNKLKKGG